jgi:EAL domain-containing protein (putative c-di-GMP-specific phosphodiesterase class I)
LSTIEGIGLTSQINQWMIETICRDMDEWNAAGRRNIRVSVKFSPTCLESDGFFEELAAQLGRFNIAPSQLEVEITESLCVRDPATTIERLNKLAGRGFQLALGEFGTDQSSLDLLHRLPIHTLRIDRSFVSEINDRNGYYPFVRAVISLAHGLGLKIVAEGVTTRIQSEYLAEAGCETMQGDLFFHPLAKVDAEKILFRTPARAGLG